MRTKISALYMSEYGNLISLKTVTTMSAFSGRYSIYWQ